MTPQPQPQTSTRITRATLLLAVGGALFFLAMPANASEHDQGGGNDDNVTLCHATGSDETNPYVLITTDAEGAYNGHIGEPHQHAEDIIPPFTYEGTEYSQNWDAEGQAIFDGCEPEDTGSETETETSGSETETETSGSETDSETEGSDTDSDTSGSDTDTETEEIPVFGTATTLALGIGGALGGALLMLRRKL